MSGICFNTSTIRNCGLTLPQKIELVAAVGYDAVELWVSEINDYLHAGGTLTALRQMVKQNSLQVINLIAFPEWGSPDPDTRQAALQETVAIFETAQTLGCPYVAAPPAGLTARSDIPLRDLADRYQALIDATAHLLVTPLLEFWGHSRTLGSLRDALEIMRLLDNPETLLLADVFHMAKTPGSTELLATLDAKRLGLFHLNDYPLVDDIRKLSDAERIYPGDGVAPLPQIIDTLRGNGYTGMYSLELFNEGYEAMGAEHVARTGLARMRALLS